MPEVWDLLPGTSSRADGFSAENGQEALRRHFEAVERRDVTGSVVFANRDAAHRCVSASPRWAHLADDLPPFDGPLVATKHVAVFVAERSA
jgi:hypothetical protein